MATQTELVEKPDHIDLRRMRHISDADLFSALDLSQPALIDVKSAVERQDWTAAAQAWSVYFRQRSNPVPITNLTNYATYLKAHDPARANDIIAAATKLWSAEIDYTDRAKGKSGLYGFHYMTWMEPLSEAYAIDGDQRHAEAFTRLFNLWYATRDDVHGEWPMDVVWYTLGLSIRTPRFARYYHTFRHLSVLDDATQLRLLKTILGAARWLAEEHNTFRYGNWQHHGVTGLFELATFWPEFKEANAWADLAWQRLLDHLELDVYSDGGHLERAPSYHTGVLDGYQRVALAAELNWTKRLQDHPRFPAMYRWLMTQSTPLGMSTNFNDSGLVWVGPYLAQGAVVCSDPELKWLVERSGTSVEIGRSLSKLPNRPNGESADAAFAALVSQAPASPSELLPASKFAVMRGGWESQKLFLTVSYGPLVGHELESHSHNDPLSFIAVGRGRPLAIEAGCPASYDDPHYYDWYQAAISHNIVLVDDNMPSPQRKDGDLVHWSTSPIADVFQATHAGYNDIGVAHRRTIVFVRDSYWLVHDELQSDQPHRYGWQLYSPRQLHENGGSWSPDDGNGLNVQPILPGTTVERIGGVAVVANGIAYEGTDERREVDGLRFTRTGSAGRTCFFHLLNPSGDSEENLKASKLAVGQNRGEAAIIERASGQDIVAIAASGHQELWTAGDWTSDAQVWFVGSDGAWFVCNGSTLSRNGAPIFESSGAVGMIACWSDGSGWLGQINAERRAVIRLGDIAQWTHINLNGVDVPSAEADGVPSFLIPAAGMYHFRIE